MPDSHFVIAAWMDERLRKQDVVGAVWCGEDWYICLSSLRVLFITKSSTVEQFLSLKHLFIVTAVVYRRTELTTLCIAQLASFAWDAFVRVALVWNCAYLALNYNQRLVKAFRRISFQQCLRPIFLHSPPLPNPMRHFCFIPHQNSHASPTPNPPTKKHCPIIKSLPKVPN